MKHIVFSVAVLAFVFAGCSKTTEPSVAPPSGSGGPKEEKKILITGYLPDYGFNRIDFKNLSYLDRVNYFSVEPDVNGYFQMSVSDSTNIELLKTKLSSQQQLFLVVGGWAKSINIPAMAADANKRSAYLQSLVGFCKRHGINGVDLDWEDNPGPINQTTYVTLVKEWSKALHEQNLLFSVALGVSKPEWGYKVKDDVDQINLMIYGTLDASGNQSTMLQTTNALNGFADPGIPKSKLLAGVPFYGKRAAAPVSLEYSSIVAQAHPDSTLNKYNDYSFNGQKLLRDKVALLRQNGYGGIMIWELSQDVSVDSEFSLLKAIYNRNK